MFSEVTGTDSAKQGFRKEPTMFPGSRGSESVRKGTLFFLRSKCQEFWTDPLLVISCALSPFGFTCLPSTPPRQLKVRFTIERVWSPLYLKLYWLSSIGNWFFYNWLTFDIFSISPQGLNFFYSELKYSLIYMGCTWNLQSWVALAWIIPAGVLPAFVLARSGILCLLTRKAVDRWSHRENWASVMLNDCFRPGSTRSSPRS